MTSRRFTDVPVQGFTEECEKLPISDIPSIVLVYLKSDVLVLFDDSLD